MYIFIYVCVYNVQQGAVGAASVLQIESPVVPVDARMLLGNGAVVQGQGCTVCACVL